MKHITFSLSEFINRIYGYDMEEMVTGDFFNISTDWITIENDDIVKAKTMIAKTVDEETLREAISNAKSKSYEFSYIDEYITEFRSQIGNKILKDFENLQKFMSEELEKHKVEGSFTVKLDWYNDRITFSGKLKALEAIVLEITNNYGLFCYRDLKEFKILNAESNIKERIDNHLGWLKEVESIYGTIYNFFKFDNKFIDYYGTMGSTEFDKDTLLDEIDLLVA